MHVKEGLSEEFPGGAHGRNRNFAPGQQHEIAVHACSFSTSEDTKAYLSKSHGELIREEDAELLQNKSPKVDAGTLQPISWPKDPSQEWCAFASLSDNVSATSPVCCRPH